MEIILKAILAAFLVICFVTDLKKDKIYNWVVSIFIIIGIALHFSQGKFSGNLSCVVGGFVPVLLFAPFFIMKMIDAREIKVLSVIGFLMGIRYSLNAILYSIIASIVIYLIIVVIKKKKTSSAESSKNILLSKNLLNYMGGHGKFPFVTGVFLGSVLQLIINYEFIFFK
ncbi:hypothetical protein NNC19_17675 [Clostridium sp. SHJSY1]|uniref:prepilin peptidase n=1 Tax=Clostridium sp. SHJSY1 TaxID=2942483 RepID=UPI002876BF34|nr:prepilin peptidase [Clostridium sp. SHJSY1]MDS0527523.1 hypothetical protein [Clostridium sp. SHJSY1]